MLRRNLRFLVADTTSVDDGGQPTRHQLSLFAPQKVKDLAIFILEDRADFASQGEATLKDYPWKVAYSTDSIDEGLRIANEADFDVAILDAEVGGNKSDQVASAISGRGIPLVVCTNRPSMALGEELQRGSILQSPSLGEKLRRILEQTDRYRYVPDIKMPESMDRRS
jgi:DNA-binding NtrC family response regulator